MSSSFNLNILLGDIATIKGGKRLPKGHNLVSKKNKHPYIKVKDMNGGKVLKLNDSFEFVEDEAQKKIENYIVKKNDLIISIVGTIGLVSMIDASLDNANLTENCVKIVDIQNMDSNFLYYFLTSKDGQEEMRKGTVGSTQPKLPIYNIKKISIPLLPLPEQKAIAHILSTLDEKIEVNNQINKTLENIAQTIFKQWFVDFEFPNGAKEPYKSSGGEMVESELGMIPKGWEVSKIGNYAKVKSGYAFKSSLWIDSGVPVIKIKDISNNTLNLKDCSFVSEDNAILANEFRIFGGEILIAMTGATIGKFAIVPKVENYALVNQRVGKFNLGTDSFNRVSFLYCILNQATVYDEIVSRGDGSAQPNISPKGIESIKIILPNEIILEKFNKSMKYVFKKVTENIYENTKLARIRESLLPKLMSGDIRVPIEEN